MFLKLKILIAPLDWGLGHTTRCFPIIDYLLSKGHHVIVAADGAPAKLIKENFSQIEIITLRGYAIQYSRHKHTFSLKIASQIPKLLKSIRREHSWLKQQQKIHHFDIIISDNRYGLYLEHTKCVIMTHQLNIKTGIGIKADTLLKSLHYKLLQNFSVCWIVDKEEDGGLSGTLAHPKVIPENAKYIGFLSQLALIKIEEKRKDKPKKVILILLSGPEPMRSILEEQLLNQIKEEQNRLYQFILVAGNPSGNYPRHLPEDLIYYTHLIAQQLSAIMTNADLVICRSGYSTIMDLAALHKKALLVPTPGQTEQEYLAVYLKEKGFFLL